MEGEMVNGLAEGKWTGYEYGLVSWTEDVKNDITMSLTEFYYYDNGQISEIWKYNGSEELHGVSEEYHQNGQLKSKVEYKNGELLRVIEEYDFGPAPVLGATMAPSAAAGQVWGSRYWSKIHGMDEIPVVEEKFSRQSFWS